MAIVFAQRVRMVTDGPALAKQLGRAHQVKVVDTAIAVRLIAI
jgi:hypothetical protein